jgi:hypothetical protein
MNEILLTSILIVIIENVSTKFVFTLALPYRKLNRPYTVRYSSKVTGCVTELDTAITFYLVPRSVGVFTGNGQEPDSPAKSIP